MNESAPAHGLLRGLTRRSIDRRTAGWWFFGAAMPFVLVGFAMGALAVSGPFVFRPGLDRRHTVALPFNRQLWLDPDWRRSALPETHWVTIRERMADDVRRIVEASAGLRPSDIEAMLGKCSLTTTDPDGCSALWFPAGASDSLEVAELWVSFGPDGTVRHAGFQRGSD